MLSRICWWQNKYLDGLRICRASIEQTESKEFWLDGLKKLSRFYWEETQKSRWTEKLSRCYREGREHRKFSRWIEDLSRFLSRLKKEGSIEMNLSRIYREAVELEEKEFSRREKHIKMDATSKLLNQRSKQHIKLSKHLSTYVQSIHRSKTHTHTHNNYNQFYISKIS